VLLWWFCAWGERRCTSFSILPTLWILTSRLPCQIFN
jgi:hypothetical protein